MRRILVSALLVSASCLPALADPIQLIPSAFATHERAGAGAAVQARPQSAASGPRYVEANQPHYGGGFIELLFGGGARQLVAPRAYQPAAPDGGQPAQVPIALNMPMLKQAVAYWADANQWLGGAADHTEIARWFEDTHGMTLADG